MRKILLLTILLLAGISFSSYANNDGSLKQIRVNKETGEGTIRPKSIQTLPITVFIDDAGLVTVHFAEALNVCVEIISLEDGGTIYSDVVSVTASSTLPINLYGCDSGMYKIRFTYGDTVLSGDFFLEGSW